jgi:hypothetical protein
MGGCPIVAPLGPATGLAMAAGEGDACAELTPPSNNKSGRKSRASRMTSLFYTRP